MSSTNSTSTPLSAPDTAFVFFNSALVMFMVPGLALFYGGLVRQKNALHTVLQSMVALIIVSFQWFFWGFSLAFSSGNKVYGNLDYILLLFSDNMLTEAYPVAPTVPMIVFMIYQCMFACITAAIIAGGAAERLRFRSYCLFLFMWVTLVYCPVTHWVFAPKGWLFGRVLDFAGGTTVHVSSGAAALVFSLLLPGREGHGNLLDKIRDKIYAHFSIVAPTLPPRSEKVVDDEKKEKKEGSSHIEPHNLVLFAFGTGVLWFGWFGFNGGSALAANGLAGLAFVNTNMAAASGGLVWMILEFIFSRKLKGLAICNGAVCGLAAVTPASGYIYPGFAVLCGALASLLCFFVCIVKGKIIDDSLDPFGVHCVGGAFGVVFAGLFGVRALVFDGSGAVIGGGWWNRNWKQLGWQFAAITSIFGWSFIMTAIIIFIIWLIPLFGLRVSRYEERIGLDLTQHGESAYVFDLEQQPEEELYEGEKDSDDLASIIYQAYKRSHKSEEAPKQVELPDTNTTVPV
jgi:Amt family ammonium transporter